MRSGGAAGLVDLRLAGEDLRLLAGFILAVAGVPTRALAMAAVLSVR